VNAVKSLLPAGIEINPIVFNGVGKKDIRELKKISRAKGKENFVEVMMCEEGCVGGCNTLAKRKIAKRQIGNMLK